MNMVKTKTVEMKIVTMQSGENENGELKYPQKVTLPFKKPSSTVINEANQPMKPIHCIKESNQ